MDEQFFARVPYNLFDALRHDEITFTMFSIMVLLHRWANWHTGVVRTCSAERLQAAMGEAEKPPAIRTIQRALQGLAEAGWIVSGYKKGIKRPYSVQICNFIPVADADSDGDAEKAVISPTAISSWTETAAFQGGDEGTDTDGEKAVSRRSVGGSKETVSKTSHETSSETLNKETVGVEVKSVSQSASPHVGQDASHPPDPTEQAGIKPWTQDEIYVVQALMTEKFNMKANQAILARIQKSHPDFIWTYENRALVLAILARKDWTQSVRTPDDFAYRWNSDGEGSLFVQVMRNTPDNIPDVRHYLENEDESDTDSVGGDRDVFNRLEDEPPETLAQCAARTKPFQVYCGSHVKPVVEAYQKRVPELVTYPPHHLWVYNNGKKWVIGPDREKIENDCEQEKPMEVEEV